MTHHSEPAREAVREALVEAEAAFEAIRIILVNELDEPVRGAFWRAVQARDASRAALAAAAASRGEDWRPVLTGMVAAMNKRDSDFGDGEIPSAHRSLMWRAEQLLASPAATSAEGNGHPDDIAVDRFAAAMKAKLAKKRAEGYGGWDLKITEPGIDGRGFRYECQNSFLSEKLREHVEKGDPVDVANFAMMIHQRGERIADERERYAAKVRQRREANDGRPGGWAEARETCQTCQGNGEIITDWDRYMHSHEMDAGDEATDECPDCNGEGTINVPPAATSGDREFTSLRVAYKRGVAWAVENPGANSSWVEKAAYDYADKATSVALIDEHLTPGFSDDGNCCAGKLSPTTRQALKDSTHG